jgi:hypothetical protein
MRGSAKHRAGRDVRLRSIGWRPLALLAVLVATAVGTVGWFARPPASQSRGRLEAPVLLGTTDPRTTIDFSLILRLPGQAHLRRFLNELTDPAAPSYHHFIDAAAFGERFGVSRTVLDQASARLARDGDQVTASYPSGPHSTSARPPERSIACSVSG